MTIPRTEAMGKYALIEAFQGISIHVGELIDQRFVANGNRCFSRLLAGLHGLSSRSHPWFQSRRARSSRSLLIEIWRRYDHGRRKSTY